MTPNLAHCRNQDWIWQTNSTQSSHNYNNMEKSTPTQQTVAHDNECGWHDEGIWCSGRTGRRCTVDNNQAWRKNWEEKFTTSSNTSHQNPPSLPSTIKVKHSSDSHVSSSVPGLSSYLDMSMTEISPDNQVTMVRKCVWKHMFSIWKFYHKEYHAHYSQDERTMCGFLLKNTNLRGNHDWWLEMRRVVIKTHTDVRNNAIKNMQTKFKGKPKQENILPKCELLELTFVWGKTFATMHKS